MLNSKTKVKQKGSDKQAGAKVRVQLDTLQSKIADLTEKLTASNQRERRVLADYQNLVRRQRDERIAIIKMASKDFVEGLLQPLENLSRATEQLNDQGLSMVLKQLWLALKEQGLEEIEVMGKEFDLETMEVVEKKSDGKKVVAVVNRGYKLNGEVIQHVKVVLG